MTVLIDVPGKRQRPVTMKFSSILTKWYLTMAIDAIFHLTLTASCEVYTLVFIFIVDTILSSMLSIRKLHPGRTPGTS